jgi:hypothetical protein
MRWIGSQIFDEFWVMIFGGQDNRWVMIFGGQDNRWVMSYVLAW